MLTLLFDVTHNPAARESEIGVIFADTKRPVIQRGAIKNPSHHNREIPLPEFFLRVRFIDHYLVRRKTYSKPDTPSHFLASLKQCASAFRMIAQRRRNEDGKHTCRRKC
jgi:hypothetical protein